MKPPRSLQNVDQYDAVVRTVEYDDGTVIAIDFGHTGGELGVDVVGETAIVVTDDEQFEFDLPDEASSVAEHNGVVTIEES